MRLRRALLSGLAVVGLAVAGMVIVEFGVGHMALMSVFRHGGALFVPISSQSERLSPSMRLVLNGPVPQVAAGAFAWRDIGDGVAEGELPVMAGDKEVDRIALVRLDPARNRVVVRNDSFGGREVEDWLPKLGARFVINGSYYAPSGRPDTPFLEDGRQIGPAEYDAKQGALTVSDAGVAIHDLSKEDWHAAFAGARDALVSYPLLLGPDGKARAIKPTQWLANRSFVGLDRQGRVIFGTTKDAFFSLQRLALFLQGAPLDLGPVLNLDGGPVACQALHVEETKRSVCGDYEIQVNNGKVTKLSWPFGKRWTLPIVVAAVPR